MSLGTILPRKSIGEIAAQTTQITQLSLVDKLFFISKL